MTTVTVSQTQLAASSGVSGPAVTVVAGPTVILELGITGPRGSAGVAAAVVEVEAAEAVSAGQAIRSNAQGKMVKAQAVSLAAAGKVSLAGSSAAMGFGVGLQTGFFTLADWAGATGAVDLVPQAEYFLSASTPGMLTTTPPTTGVVLSVGTALTARTMAISSGIAVLL